MFLRAVPDITPRNYEKHLSSASGKVRKGIIYTRMCRFPITCLMPFVNLTKALYFDMQPISISLWMESSATSNQCHDYGFRVPCDSIRFDTCFVRFPQLFRRVLLYISRRKCDSEFRQRLVLVFQK